MFDNEISFYSLLLKLEWIITEFLKYIIMDLS